jgi:hypothetical protein
LATIFALSLVGVVDALAALNAQRERERVVGLRKTFARLSGIGRE